MLMEDSTDSTFFKEIENVEHTPLVTVNAALKVINPVDFVEHNSALTLTLTHLCRCLRLVSSAALSAAA